MEITRGKIQKAERVVVYGPEGIGKSTFASQFPDPLFIDTEGSTSDMDVARLPKPSSWAMVVEAVNYVRMNPGCCKTLVIDTADWAERLCKDMICSKYSKGSIEDFGYGKGYIMLAEEFGRFLNALTDLSEKGIHVVMTAHAAMRKFEEPNESGAYDRWEMKLEKKTNPIVKEWATMVLFANYEILVIKDDDKKAKAKGGKRMLYTQHHPCWDAKNRKGFADKLPFDYSSIAGSIADFTTTTTPAPAQVKTPEKQADKPEATEKVPDVAEVKKETQSSAETKEDVIKQLEDLMERTMASRQDVQVAVSQQGYYPKETPIENYDIDFIKGCLIAAWPQVAKKIQENLDNEIPF